MLFGGGHGRSVFLEGRFVRVGRAGSGEGGGVDGVEAVLLVLGVGQVLPVGILFLFFLAEFPPVGLEIGPNLRDDGEGVVDLLFEEEILIFELVAFEGGGLQCLLGLVVEGHVLLFLLGLLLEPLDEGEDLLLLLGGQVVQNSNPFASRHLNYIRRLPTQSSSPNRVLLLDPPLQLDDLGPDHLLVLLQVLDSGLLLLLPLQL